MIIKNDRDLFRDTVKITVEVHTNDVDTNEAVYFLQGVSGKSIIVLDFEEDLGSYFLRNKNYLKVTDDRLLNKLYKKLIDRKQFIWRINHEEDASIISLSQKNLQVNTVKIITDNNTLPRSAPRFITEAYRKTMCQPIRSLEVNSEFLAKHNLVMAITKSGRIIT